VDISSPIFELGVWLLSGCRHNRALDADNQFDKIAPGIIGAIKMNFSQTQDERLLAFYENVRRQVDLDMRAGGRYRLAGDGVKQYADRLRDEMDRRQLRFTPIVWNP
jgi:hypothetical protein